MTRELRFNFSAPRPLERMRGRRLIVDCFQEHPDDFEEGPRRALAGDGPPDSEA